MPGLRDGALPDYEAIAYSSRQIAITMAVAAVDSKADDVVILDLRKLSFSFDFFVLCSSSSDRRIQGIADDIEEELSKNGSSAGHREGSPEGGWVLLDHGPVVGHLFSHELREFYGLERLWADAPRLSIPKHRRHPAASLAVAARK